MTCWEYAERMVCSWREMVGKQEIVIVGDSPRKFTCHNYGENRLPRMLWLFEYH